MACRLIAIGTALVLLTAGGRLAVSQPAEDAETGPRFTIARWQAHAKCPKQEFFRRALAKALGPSSGPHSQTLGPVDGSLSQEPMQVSIHIERHQRKFKLELSTKDESGAGTRTIHAPGCKELLTTAAVIVSLAMQPDLLFQNESEREVVTVPPSLWQATDDENPSTIYRGQSSDTVLGYRDNDTSSGLKIAVGLAGVADIGTLPRAAIGLGIVASARADRHTLSFRLTQWAQQRRYVQSPSEDRGGNFDYISAKLDLCRDLVSGRITSGLCGVLGLGRLKGESIVIDLPIAQSHIMANAGSAASARLATSKDSALQVQLEVVVNFVRPKYSVVVLDEMDDTMEIVRNIHYVSPLSARLAATWGLRF